MGLAPTYLHSGTALKIGKEIGEVHLETINNRSAVAVNRPVPAGSFFQGRDEGREVWIQFKLERLPDFCFKCGFLDHVTGRCSFQEPTTITTGAGLMAKLLRALDESGA